MFYLNAGFITFYFPRITKADTRARDGLWACSNTQALIFLLIGHVRYINILAWLQGFRGQNCKFFKFLLSFNFQKRLGYKENNTKYGILTRKPRSLVRILIYRTWPICSINWWRIARSLTHRMTHSFRWESQRWVCRWCLFWSWHYKGVLFLSIKQIKLTYSPILPRCIMHANSIGNEFSICFFLCVLNEFSFTLSVYWPVYLL